MKELLVGTDFSGIGSPEQALKNLEIKHKVEFACDIDKYAKQTYLANHHCKKFYDDITTRNHSEVPQLDLYVGGFPCQAFSLAGNRKGFEEARGTLFFNMAEFIKINQPKTFILENVKGLLSHDNGKTFQTIISILSDGGGTVNGQHSIPYFDDGLGYHIYYQVLNTKEHGIPQNRERIFIVGFKDYREFRFPIKEPLNLRLKDLLQDNPSNKHTVSDKGFKHITNEQRLKKKFTQIDGNISLCLTSQQNWTGNYISVPEKYYLSDKMLNCLINHKSEKFTVTTPLINETETARTLRTEMAKMGRQDNFIKVGYINQDTQASKVFSEEGTSPTLSSGTHGYANGYVQVNSATKKGYEEAKEGDSINFSVPNSKTRRGRVGKGVSQTLDTSCNQAVITDKIRRLTPLECFRLQGFPDSFVKPCSDSQTYKQAGNSITVNVIQKIIKNIYYV